MSPAVTTSLTACARATAFAIAMALAFALASALAFGFGAPVAEADEASKDEQPVTRSTWVDHDGRPIREPKEREKSPYGHAFRENVVEPLSHTFDIPDKLLWIARGFKTEHRQAVNVNAFDEVANSTWFTNRNHVRALSAEQIRIGPGGKDIAPAPPFKIVGIKKTGDTVNLETDLLAKYVHKSLRGGAISQEMLRRAGWTV